MKEAINKIGQGDGKYTVGDIVEANLFNGVGKSWAILKGKVTEIYIDHEKGVYQLQINNGWWCHPSEMYGRDEVVIIEKHKS